MEELLDFSKAPGDFDGHYSKGVIDARQIIVRAFRSTATALPKLSFRVVYASRGDYVEPNIDARGKQLKRIVSDYFSDADVSLDFLGASELIALHRKNKFVIELPYAEQLAAELGAYIMLVRLEAYDRFVSDERGNLRRYLFDSNVRDFLGENRVNQDILTTLEDPRSPDFWWLNNGITILATSAIPLGRTAAGNALQLHDVQIVNGLQTTQTIHNYFSAGLVAEGNSRCVLVKVIVSEEAAVRDRIIRATNNQTSVELASLTATDKIQRDIEDVLEQRGWFYERRKNYYKNIGKPIERFVHPLYLAVGNVALVRKSPQLAARLKTRFMRDSESYDAVFSERLPILVWPKLVEIMKVVDKGIVGKIPQERTRPRIVATWRGATALCIVAEAIGSFDYSSEELLNLDVSTLSEKRVGEIFEFFTRTVVQSITTSRRTQMRARSELLCEQFGRENNIEGIEVIGRWTMPTSPPISRPHQQRSTPLSAGLPSDIGINSETLAAIRDALPPQPWKPGAQQAVMQKTGIALKDIRKGMKLLIKTGAVNHQIDGVVINSEGIIVALDAERADSTYKIGDSFVRRRCEL